MFAIEARHASVEHKLVDSLELLTVRLDVAQKLAAVFDLEIALYALHQFAKGARDTLLNSQARQSRFSDHVRIDRLGYARHHERK